MREAETAASAGLQKILLALVIGIAGIDIVWGLAGHFDIDAPAYLRLAALSVALLAAGTYYRRMRGEPRLSAMLNGTGFLCGFSAAASLLNYLLLTVAGPRIDVALAGADRMLGFDWPALMRFAAAWPFANAILHLAYVSMLPQIALLIVLLAWSGRCEEMYRFCLAIAVAALIAIALWTALPSFGAFSVYDLPPALVAKLDAALDQNYGRALVGLLKDGPGRIEPSKVQGLIGFPSYHAVLALLVIWYGRHLPRLFPVLLLLDSIVIVATPIHGGHHIVDVAAALPVTVFALYAVSWLEKLALRVKPLAGRAQNPLNA